MPEIEVQTEEESGRGWVYHAVIDRDGHRTEHTVTLSWADHELWSGGRIPPSKVLEVLLAFLLEHGKEVPGRFDAATVRRWLPEVDQQLPGRF